jgi:hypothetical protein
VPQGRHISRNNPGKFPNRNYPKVNHLNTVIFDEPSEPDGDDEDGFDGLQYNPDDNPAYAGNEPHNRATEGETPHLGTV